MIYNKTDLHNIFRHTVENIHIVQNPHLPMYACGFVSEVLVFLSIVYKF